MKNERRAREELWLWFPYVELLLFFNLNIDTKSELKLLEHKYNIIMQLLDITKYYLQYIKC